MSCDLSIFVGTFLEVPKHTVEKLYKVSMCPVCNIELKSSYCPNCGTVANPIVNTKPEPLDVYALLQEHDIRAHSYYIEKAPNERTYIINCRDSRAGVFVNIDEGYVATPIVTENNLVPYLDIMQLFDDEKVPYNVITGAFTYWG
jgi:hypothetical protein